MNKKRVLITSALPYTNGRLHLGHLAGAYLSADIYARFRRLMGDDVVYICGSDEHGVPITLLAEKKNTTPQNIIDHYHKKNIEDFTAFGISFDYYGRTSSSTHHKTAQDFFLTLWRKKHLIKKKNKQFYDEKLDRFLPDRYVQGTCPKCHSKKAYGDQCESCGRSLSANELIDPHSIISGKIPILRETEHWYLSLAEEQSTLTNWLLSKTTWKKNVIQQCKSWLQEGLIDRAVTRDLNWGIPVPLKEAHKKVLYVWFEALIGYISATKEWAQKQGNKTLWKKYWQNDATENYFFIGKDNIVFHCIILPAMLMKHGGYNLPNNIPANEFLNLEGQKLSTSNGWAVWLHEYLHDFKDPDLMRYCLASILPENRDVDFYWQVFQDKVNNELVAVWGNFVNRIQQFIHRYYDGYVPKPNEFDELDKTMLSSIEIAKEKISVHYFNFSFREGVWATMELARLGNKYFSDSMPWKTYKDNPTKCATCIYISVQVIAALSILFSPIIPFACQKLKTALHLSNTLTWNDVQKHIIKSDTKIDKLPIIFQKVENENIQKQYQKLHKNNTTS